MIFCNIQVFSQNTFNQKKQKNLPQNGSFTKKSPLHCQNFQENGKNALKKCEIARKRIILPKLRKIWVQVWCYILEV